VANQQSAGLAEPRVGSLDNPAALGSSEFSPVFVLPLLAVLGVGSVEVDASSLEPYPSGRVHGWRL
jgi:hypothetical protein